MSDANGMSDRSNIDQMLFQAACYESNAAEAKYDVALQQKRPFMLLRPKISKDGAQWCALLGENMQIGVCGFGDTPEAAAIAFDLEWLNGTTTKEE